MSNSPALKILTRLTAAEAREADDHDSSEAIIEAKGIRNIVEDVFLSSRVIRTGDHLTFDVKGSDLEVPSKARNLLGELQSELKEKLKLQFSSAKNLEMPSGAQIYVMKDDHKKVVLILDCVSQLLTFDLSAMD